jgi:hypothetical protein
MTWLPSIGLPELLGVLAVALVIFGGSRLPEAGDPGVQRRARGGIAGHPRERAAHQR